MNSVIQKMFCILFLVSSPVCSREIVQNYRFLVVFGVESVDASSMEFRGNVFPWERTMDGLTTNACGFVKVVYRGKPIREFIQDSEINTYKKYPVNVQISETCDIGEKLFHKPTLIVVREWDEALFLIGSTELFQDSKQEYFVSSKSFIDKFEVSEHLKAIEEPEDFSECKDISIYSDYMKEALESRSYSEIKEEDFLCMKKGVYLKDVPSDRPTSPK